MENKLDICFQHNKSFVTSGQQEVSLEYFFVNGMFRLNCSSVKNRKEIHFAVSWHEEEVDVASRWVNDKFAWQTQKLILPNHCWKKFSSMWRFCCCFVIALF